MRTCIYETNDIFITQHSYNGEDLVFTTETTVSPYISAILSVRLPTKITVAEVTISPNLIYNTNTIYSDKLVDRINRINKNIQTKLQKSILAYGEPHICSIYIKNMTNTPGYYLDTPKSLSTTYTSILSSAYWKHYLKPNVRIATFKNTLINEHIIHKKCPTCITQNGPLVDGLHQYTKGDLRLYPEGKPYLLQTLYTGLNKYRKEYNTDVKYVLVLLTTSDFMLYEMYVNFLGFIDLGIVLDTRYNVICIEYPRILSILKQMLVFLNH